MFLNKERKEKQKFFEKLLTRRNEMKQNFDLVAATAATKSSLKTRQRTDKRERGERSEKLQGSGLEKQTRQSEFVPCSWLKAKEDREGYKRA